MDKEYKELLKEFVSLQSVSTDPAFKGEIDKTVKWIEEQFKKNDFKLKTYKDLSCNPVVFAEYNVNPDAKTILIYGHYDVQPAQKSDGWNSEPFDLSERNGRLYGRGVVDNKGQILIHMYSAFKMIKKDRMKYNVKFLIEGNEETSNADLPKLMREYGGDWKSDYVIVSDGEIIADNPVIERSLRGGFNAKLVYRTAKNNLHSGIFGGAAPNSAHELAKFVNSLYTDGNRINIEGFYENVDPISDDERSVNKKMSELNGESVENAGFKTLTVEDDNDFFTQIGCRPSINVTGFKSGYIDEGFANIIPAEAEVRLNFRLVRSQTSKEIMDLFEKYVADKTPKYVDYELTFHSMHEAVKIDTSDPFVSYIKDLLEDAYGKEVLYKRVGGAIPFVSDVKELWGIDTLLISMGNDDCNMHGADENFKVDLIEKALKFCEKFYSSEPK